MSPHSFSKLDPDLLSPKKLDPDPHKVNADPKHCMKWCSKRGELRDILAKETESKVVTYLKKN
jgi:hypothetical protein